MSQALKVGDKVYAPDYQIRGTIEEIKDIGYGPFYRVLSDDGTVYDLDPTEVKRDKLPAGQKEA